MYGANRAIGSDWRIGGVLGLALLLAALPLAASAQEHGPGRGDAGGGRPGESRGEQRGGDRGGQERGGPERGGQGGEVRGDPGSRGTEHTDRGEVRGDRSEERDAPSRAVFTRSAEGKRYDNGVELRAATRYKDQGWDTFFPTHYYSFPHYARTSVSVDVVASPFHFYYGTCPPFLERGCIIFGPPSAIYVEVPVYVGHTWHGYPSDDDDDDYYLHRRADTRWKDDSELRHAVYDLEDAFRDSNIDLLVGLTDPDTKIALFAKGKYEYSMKAGDYLDVTRDFMRSSDTVAFDVYRVHYRSRDVYQLFAKHTYKSKDDKKRYVYLCIALERIDGRWTMTQVDTSPDRID